MAPSSTRPELGPLDAGDVTAPPPPTRFTPGLFPLSNGARRVWGCAAVLPAWLIAFPTHAADALHHANGGQVMAWLGAYLLWMFPSDRLFVASERISGMRYVRREISVRPAEGDEHPAAVFVDGRAVGTASNVDVLVCRVGVLRPSGREAMGYEGEATLALVAGGIVYRLDHDRHEPRIRQRAEQLVAALGAGARTLRDKNIGNEGWPVYDLHPSLLLSGLAPLFAALGGALWGFPPGDARVIAVGVFALAVRAAVSVRQLGLAMAPQRDTHAFARRFLGAAPAFPPIRWLTPRVGGAVLLAAWLGLFAVLASLALGPR